MSLDWPTTLKTQQVTCGASAASVTLLSTTREVVIMNTGTSTAYVRTKQLGGDAEAASGSLYIAGSAGYERIIPVGSGETLSYIQGTGAAVLEITELG